MVKEIRGLAEALGQKVVRLSQIQWAVSKGGVVGFMAGEYGGYVKAGLVGAAITALLKKLGVPL